MGYGWGWMDGMHGFFWGGWLWLVLIAIVLIAVLWRRPLSGDGGRRPRETPHEILRRRLAAGEITPQEYEQRKALLDRDLPGEGSA